MTPTEILQALEKRGKNQREAADAIGLDYVKFNKVVRQVRKFTAEEDRAFRAWLKKTPEAREEERSFDHQAGIAVRDDVYYDVPAFDIDAAAGAGTWVEEAEPEHFLKFRREWLRDLSTNLSQLVVLRVRGDSMWETLHDGDHVLVDMAQINPRREGLYTIRIDDVLQVKRISMHPVQRTITIKSDNPNYPTYADVDPKSVSLLGRVIWIGRRV
ncbi:MAG: LexA family transcriptional regulator [Alphaproteobacteria bacterium]|nr:LexA family transcriptional regulator [Alphaproteobacteria bacterium]